MSEIDWSKAPEGAEKFNLINGMFYRGDRPHLEVFNTAIGEWTKSELMEKNELFVDKPSAQPWTGAGLPPVGTVCEFKEHARESWAECTIIGEFMGKIVCGCNKSGAVGYIDLEELRPIRTPEQIADEEREKEIAGIGSILASYGPTFRDQASALYDAGLRFTQEVQK